MAMAGDGEGPSSGPESEELLRLVLESATDYAIFSTDPEGRVTSWNVGAERVLGFAEAEILGRSGDVIFTEEDRAGGVPEMERRVAFAEGRARDDRWTARADGSRFWASGLMMPLADRSQGFVKILRDRTDQHMAQQRLQESEERFRLLATNVPQLVFLSQPDGRRTWGSPQWIAFTGLSLEQSVGFGWFEAIHPDDRDLTHAAWSEAQRTGECYVEHRVRSAAGEYRWHQTRARPSTENATTEWVGTMTDVHDLRDIQDRQQVLMAELQHRTRNLLAVVQAIASQTARSSRSLAEFSEEFESRLGALSRVQSLVARADRGVVNVRELVKAELAAHGGGAAAVDGPFVALPATSAQALGLALHELATNALKYGALAHPDGRLEVAWEADEADGERTVTIVWQESGVPIAEPPSRKGYGSELIERALPYQLRAKTQLRFDPDGVRCIIQVPMRLPGLG